MPATPKPPGQRRRRNAGQSQWKELPAKGPKGKIPDLPEGDWLVDTVEWWETVWSSPMANVFQPADVDSLIRLARLKDADTRGELAIGALGQITALEDRFGLSPKARRQLQWEISTSEGKTKRAPTRNRHLRAVGQ